MDADELELQSLRDNGDADGYYKELDAYNECIDMAETEKLSKVLGNGDVFDADLAADLELSDIVRADR